MPNMLAACVAPHPPHCQHSPLWPLAAHLALQAVARLAPQALSHAAYVERLLGVLPRPLKLQRLGLGGEAIEHQHHLPGPSPAQRAQRGESGRAAGQVGDAGGWVGWPQLVPAAPRAAPRSAAAAAHPLVLLAPLTSSPLCWRMRRRGLTVNLWRQQSRGGRRAAGRAFCAAGGGLEALQRQRSTAAAARQLCAALRCHRWPVRPSRPPSPDVAAPLVLGVLALQQVAAVELAALLHWLWPSGGWGAVTYSAHPCLQAPTIRPIRCCPQWQLIISAGTSTHDHVRFCDGSCRPCRMHSRLPRRGGLR